MIMKTEEWMKQWARQPNGPTPISTTVKTEQLKEALLEACKDGMTEAANIVQRRQFPMQDAPICSGDAKAILTARDSK